MKQPWIATALVAWGAGTSCLAPAGLWGRPNILLITADDMHWDSVGAYGCPVAATTPTIDRLAAEEFRFHDAYVPISLCTPSRQVLPVSRERGMSLQRLSIGTTMKRALTLIPALLLAPLAPMGRAAEPLRSAAQPSLSLPAKADLPDVGRSRGKRYNVLFIAVDDLNDWVGCMGVLFDAMEKSKYADDTLIMIWGDHGWHLSEKMKYGKTDLWEESDRVPFIVAVPGLTPPGFKCEGVVNLLDMYPTLVELCGLPPNPENEGRSFAPLLKNPGMDWNHPTLTTYQFKNHSLTDGRYRYTWYGGRADGAEELYDHSTDPMEHKNLASDPEYSEVIAGFKKHLPTHDEPDSPRNGAADGDKKAMRKRGESNHDD